MTKYKVIEYHYEFNTEHGEKWNDKELLNAIFELDNVCGYELEIFENEDLATEKAKELAENNKPYEMATSNGYVITGKWFEVEKHEDDEQDFDYHKIFAKGTE